MPANRSPFFTTRPLETVIGMKVRDEDVTACR
jgi:hypothetical protein